MADLWWRDDAEGAPGPVTLAHPLPVQHIRPGGDPLPTRPGIPLAPTTGDTGAMTDTAAHVCLAAPGPAESILVTQITLSNSSATATVVAITGIVDARSGKAVTYHAPAAANSGGSVLLFNPPLLGQPGTAISATCLTNATNTFCSGNGYVVESLAEVTA